jgi:diguanylate cyclase (GGDEF)-like protein/PAS domain S-box-containing protein
MNASQSQRTHSVVVQWALLGLAWLIVGGVLGSNLYQMRVSTEEREKQRLLSQTQIIKQILDTSLVSLYSVLEEIGKDRRHQSHKDMAHRLGDLSNALSGVRTLVVLDGQGIARASNRPELVGRDFSQREYFQAVRNAPDPDMLYISPPFKTVLGVFAVNVTRMAQGPDGGFVGAVTATLDPEYFTPLLRAVLYAPDMRVSIIHADGVIFVAAPNPEDLVGKYIDQPGSFLRKHRDSGQIVNVFRGKTYATGEARLLALRTIHPVGVKLDKSLDVIASRDPNEIFQDWRRDAISQGWLFGLVVLASSLVLLVTQRLQRSFDLKSAQAAKALEDKARFMKVTTDNLPGMVGYWDETLRCKYANQAYLTWFGKTVEQMQDISMQELMGEALFTKNEPFIRAALRGEPQLFERTLVKADGSTGYTLARYIPDRHEDQVQGFFVLIADVTELKTTQLALERHVQELDILASTDGLTKIANRRYFLERAEEEINRSNRYGLPLVFLMLDIDHFKTVNDTHGHDAGDEILIFLAATLSDSVRATDLFGRLGGEEFGAVLIQTDIEGAKLTAERLRQTLEDAAVETKSGPIRFTVSIGLATNNGKATSVEEIMKHADIALYNAKGGGRNRVSIAES